MSTLDTNGTTRQKTVGPIISYKTTQEKKQKVRNKDNEQKWALIGLSPVCSHEIRVSL